MKRRRGRVPRPGGPRCAASIKALIRARDGYRCRLCGLRDQDHRERYGSGLQVHRKIPGSAYSLSEDCITVCIPCHGPLPRRAQGTAGTPPRLSLFVHPDVRHALQIAAAKEGVAMGALANSILREALALALAEIRQRRPWRPFPPG